MRDELTYVLITPYSLLKSRTGGIIARLLSLGELEFVGARMYAPSDEFVERYCETLESEHISGPLRDVLEGYVRSNFTRHNRFGISNRTMLLLFRGPDAVRKLLSDLVGELSPDVVGDTLRGTYGDFVVSGEGKVEFFEPAVLMPTCGEANRRQLALLSEYVHGDGGILTDVVQFLPDAEVETTLVIIKPDNFWRRSSRPGNIIDVFSRTGLYIVGAKVMHMTKEQAEEFYGPLREIFVAKLQPQVTEKLRALLGEGFGFALDAEAIGGLSEQLKEPNAEHEFRKIVDYMSGRNGGTPDVDLSRSLALLYQGENAIAKIRDRLGATNPESAEEGTVRSIYGYDLMRNGAHASDSRENAERERRIVGLWEEKETCEVQLIIDEYLT